MHNYNVALINTELQALFVLVRTKHRTISEFEKLQHATTVYDQIKQPSNWQAWVETQQQNIYDGIITNCQTFKNSAAIKHLSITKKSGFQGSLATKDEDIVAMLSKIIKGVTPCSEIDKNKNKALDGTRKYAVPPFFKDTVNGTIAKKVGDTKT